MKTERSQVFYRGLVAGLLGYAAVALFFAIVNAVAGRSPFHTAALLGQAYFYGLRDASQLTLAPGPVLAFNGLHLLVFLVLGAIAAWLADLAERGPRLWYVGVVIFLFILFHMLGFLLVLTEEVRRAIAPWTLVAAGGVACVAMVAYLIGARPELRNALRVAEPD